MLKKYFSIMVLIFIISCSTDASGNFYIKNEDADFVGGVLTYFVGGLIFLVLLGNLKKLLGPLFHNVAGEFIDLITGVHFRRKK